MENKQDNDFAAFRFRSCSLPLSSTFLGCDPHSSWEEALFKSFEGNSSNFKGIQVISEANNQEHC